MAALDDSVALCGVTQPSVLLRWAMETLSVSPELAVAHRLLRKATLLSDGCWAWNGTSLPRGYGLTSYHGRNVLAHRLSYELFVEPIPAGLIVDHKCRNPRCVRPDHLQAISQQENVERGKRRVACPKGHLFTAENTYRSPKGHRRCRACRQERSRAWRKAHLEEARAQARESYRRHSEKRKVYIRDWKRRQRAQRIGASLH